MKERIGGSRIPWDKGDKWDFPDSGGSAPLSAVLGDQPPTAVAPPAPSTAPPSVASDHHLAAPVGPCPDCGCPGWWLSRLRDRWRCGDCEPWPTRVLVVDIALVVIGDDGQLEAEVIPGFGLHRRLGEDSRHCDEPPIDVEFQRQAAGGGRRRGICELHFERLERERRDLDA